MHLHFGILLAARQISPSPWPGAAGYIINKHAKTQIKISWLIKYLEVMTTTTIQER
jgi:hypothetical protein